MDGVAVALEHTGANENASNAGWARHDSALFKLLQAGEIGGAMVQIASYPFNVNYRTLSGWTPLHIAAVRGYDKIITDLLVAGAEVNCSNDYGLSPLMLAVDAGRPSCVMLLLQAGANVNQVKDCGTTALMMACLRGHLQIAHTLVEAGGKVSAADMYGVTPLIHAAKSGNLELVDYLIKTANAEVDKSDNYGTTALMAAGKEGHIHIVKALIQAGANANTSDHGGWTVLMHSCVCIRNSPCGQGESQAGALVRYLLETEALIGSRNKLGQTAIDIISFTTRAEVADLLRKASSCWAPQSSRLFGKSFNTVVLTLRMVEKKLVQPALPRDLWDCIIAFLSRDFYCR